MLEIETVVTNLINDNCLLQKIRDEAELELGGHNYEEVMKLLIQRMPKVSEFLFTLYWSEDSL